jgi:hypothetical protein
MKTMSKMKITVDEAGIDAVNVRVDAINARIEALELAQTELLAENAKLSARNADLVQNQWEASIDTAGAQAALTSERDAWKLFAMTAIRTGAADARETAMNEQRALFEKIRNFNSTPHSERHDAARPCYDDRVKGTYAEAMAGGGSVSRG